MGYSVVPIHKCTMVRGGIPASAIRPHLKPGLHPVNHVNPVKKSVFVPLSGGADFDLAEVFDVVYNICTFKLLTQKSGTWMRFINLMKTNPISILIAACSLMLSPLSILAQGSLTPPGAPAPTMVTLQQIEPRVPISAAIEITSPGSYYLTGNISVVGRTAIYIAANNVTLDLNGFTIFSTAGSASGSAILLDACTNVSVFNGNITSSVTYNGATYSGGGFAYGIYSEGTCANLRASRITVNGCLDDGINLGINDSSVAEFCTVNTVGGVGVSADSVANCTALLCGLDGIYGIVVQNCYGSATGNDDGVVADTSAINCYGTCAGNGAGVSTELAENCDGYCSSDGMGLDVLDNAINSTGYSSTGEGISAATAQNCQGGSSGNNNGIYAQIAMNCQGNSQTGNGISAVNLAENCVGSSNAGTDYGVISYANAVNCVGFSENGGGVYASSVATGCTGTSYGSGTGVQADIAQTCDGSSNTGTGVIATVGVSCVGSGAHTYTITDKYNMP
jgi:hypothetical protein